MPQLTAEHIILSHENAGIIMDTNLKETCTCFTLVSKRGLACYLRSKIVGSTPWKSPLLITISSHYKSVHLTDSGGCDMWACMWVGGRELLTMTGETPECLMIEASASHVHRYDHMLSQTNCKIGTNLTLGIVIWIWIGTVLEFYVLATYKVDRYVNRGTKYDIG